MLAKGSKSQLECVVIARVFSEIRVNKLNPLLDQKEMDTFSSLSFAFILGKIGAFGRDY